MNNFRLLLLLSLVGAAATGCGGSTNEPRGVDPARHPVGSRVFPEPGSVFPDDLPQEVGARPKDTRGGGPVSAAVKVVGSADNPHAIRFVFDAPVHEGPEPDKPFPARVVLPEGVDLATTWIRSDTLSISPRAGWPMARRLEVRLEGLEGGRSLAEPRVATLLTNPLRVLTQAGSLLYPTWLGDERAIALEWNQPIPTAPRESLRFEVAPTREALVAGKGKPVPFDVERVDDRALRLVMATPARTGSWYRLVVPAGFTGQGPEPMGSEWVSYLRGPEPFAATGLSCGWPRCTTEDTWSLNFNAEVDETSLKSCLQVQPAIEWRSVVRDGWSVQLAPRAPKVGVTYRVKATTACRSTKGDAIVAPFEATLTIALPSPRLSMVTGTGFMPVATDGTAPSIGIVAAHTGPLELGIKRLAPEELGSFFAEHLEEWGGLDLSKVTFDNTRAVEPRSGKVAVDLGPALVNGRGLVLVGARAHAQAPDQDGEARTALVQVTDLGLVVKSGPQDTLVWVTSLTDRAALGGVEVELRSRDGAVSWRATTDEQGLARGPGVLVESDDTKAGRVIVARKGEDMAFLDLKRWQNRTDPYEFGLLYAWNPQADVLRGQIFTERGVYRAGEKVYIKGFARLDRGRALEPVPARRMRLKVVDARGNPALSEDVELGSFGDFDTSLDLPATAPLGGWQIAAEAIEPNATAGAPVTINGSLTGNFRVEAYRPSTFEVKVRDPGLNTETLRATVTGRYYSGAAMAGAGLRWWITASDAGFSPKGFETFNFGGRDADSYWWAPSETSVPVTGSGEGQLDDAGAFALEAPLGSSLANALSTGPKNLLIEAEVTDVDQQTIAGRETLRVESADVYVGVKLSTRFVGAGERVKATIVGVAPDGTPREPANATLRLSKRTWTNTWEDSAGGGKTWVSKLVDTHVLERPLTGLAARSEVEFEVPSSGTWLVEVVAKDLRGRESVTRTQLWAWGSGASWREEEHLTVIAEQETWKVGDTARFIVQSPFPDAQALITIERSGVIERRVVKVEGTAPLIEVPVTADMAPNAYVSVALVGTPRATPDVREPPPEMRLGYARLGVDTADQKLAVEVSPAMPDYRPGQQAKVVVSLADASGRPVPGQVTLMVVDEGVLSLTGYRTPDPHLAMNVERPLSVTTSDARKSLWQRLSAEEGMKSDWGGGGEGGEPQNFRSAFATTAAFLPRVEVPEDGKAEVAFDLPDNLTRFRVMAVAASRDGRFGSGESSIEVNKPLMVRPALPRFASVGDTFEARSVLTVLAGKRAEVEVEVTVSGPVELLEAATKKVEVGQGAMPVAFRARALAPGRANFRVKATSPDGTSDAFEVPLTIEWPANTREVSMTGWLPATTTAEQIKLALPEGLRTDVGGLKVTVSTSRLGELLPSLDYLLEYPYGCVEQTTGGTLPLLAMDELLGDFELPGLSRSEVVAKARAGIDRLVSMQTWSGGLGYWPGEQNPHPWGSAYAGLALASAARHEALRPPEQTLTSLQGYLRDVLRGQAAAGQEEWRHELDQVKPLAAWVLAQLGAPEPSFHAQMFSARATLPDFGRLLLALAIDESRGDRQMIETLLDEVLANVKADEREARLVRREERYYWSTMDSDLRANALLVMVLDRVRPSDALLPKLVAGMMSDRREGHWGNTQDNAFALLALARHFVRTESAAGDTAVMVSIGDERLLDGQFGKKTFAPMSVEVPMSSALGKNGQVVSISKKGDGPVYWTLSLAHAPANVPRHALERGLRIDRRYVFASGPRAGQTATEVDAGDVVRVELNVESAEDRRYVAIDDPLPAGFEPILTSLTTTASSLTQDVGEPEEPWQPRTFNYAEQRDDRVNLFADWLPAGSHNHSYLVRATTRGRFIAPTAAVHAMYSPTVFGRSDALDVVVR